MVVSATQVARDRTLHDAAVASPPHLAHLLGTPVKGPSRERDARVTRFAIRRAQLADVERVAPLFDAYRVFYQQQSDLDGARSFLRERLGRDESVVFVAESDAGDAVGFVQLYPVFSSTATPPGRVWLLNDLFVVDAMRRHGIGRALLERAERLARETGAVGLTLSTATDNLRAQRLYEAMGYRRETIFFVYNRMLIEPRSAGAQRGPG